jgi:hypothetical protein
MSFSTDDDPTVLPAPGASGVAAGGDAPRLADGQRVGAYRVVRLLGRGGMGEVYEAEHLDHGRRVAIKVLNQQLAGREDRARFLREGQLAASLNHPNTVYVFGSEEIGGNPVISMELVSGGTLKDRVDREGPMAPPFAVDAILQVVAGLNAALARGVLHRDIKPSNCFVEPDGTVKVGDFGLSIPVESPEATQAGEMATFQGTPQFAAPEQLRGKRLDVRADIYAVGATLYYLITGHAPFEDRDLMALLARVAGEAPRPPSRPGVSIPAGLSALVLRCLAKEPASRPASYAELEAGLRPFNSAVPAPAAPGMRLVAGLVDLALLAALTAPLVISPVLELTGTSTINASVRYSTPRGVASPLWLMWAAPVLSVLYFGVAEGRWGRSLGKLVCGLQVVASNGQPASARQTFLRALLFALPNWVVTLPMTVATLFGSAAALAGMPLVGVGLGYGGDALLLLLFSSVRRRNGFAAWHDLATGTRVAAAPRVKRREPIAPAVAAQAADTRPDAARVFGPYRVTGTLEPAADATVWLGVDAALKRDVWIRQVPPGTPAVGPLRARLGRRGRLRWLNGQRSADAAWDAWEAPDGAPLTGVCAGGRPWRVVQHWLADLAAELSAAAADGSMPALAVDRVWITARGEARLLDFPAPDRTPRSESASAVIDDPQVLLGRVAAWALAGAEPGLPAHRTAGAPLPLGAREAVQLLDRGGFPSLSAAAARLAFLAEGLDEVSRPRRAASILLANLPLGFALLALAVALPTAVRVLQGEFLAMSKALMGIHALEAKEDAAAVRRRESLEIYAADRFRAAMEDERTWRDPRTAGLLTPLRPIAARILSSRRTLTEEERRAAHVAAEAEIGNTGSIRTQAMGVAIVLPAAVLLVTAVVAISMAFVVRGGLVMRLLGLAVVSSDGAEASRPRAAWRAAVAWSPVLTVWVLAWVVTRGNRDFSGAFARWWWAPAVAAVVAAAGCAWAILSPPRGAAERVTGTSLVPR